MGIVLLYFLTFKVTVSAIILGYDFVVKILVVILNGVLEELYDRTDEIKNDIFCLQTTHLFIMFK